jgi:flagellar L-ring protein precursor FlgH
MRLFLSSTIWLGLLLTGCAELRDLRGDPLPPMAEPTIQPAAAYTATAGSLWRGEQSRHFLAFENRARRPGDLVTVVIKETANAETTANTEVKRNSSYASDLDSDVALQTLVTRPIRNLLGFFGFTSQHNDSDPSESVNIVDASTDTQFKGEGTSDRESTFTTTIACLVTDVAASGLLRIEGERHITINRETQVIRFSGYVRPEDVQIDNTIPSSLVASADIYYGGRGAVSDKQRVPWLARLFDLVLPF